MSSQSIFWTERGKVEEKPSLKLLWEILFTSLQGKRLYTIRHVSRDFPIHQFILNFQFLSYELQPHGKELRNHLRFQYLHPLYMYVLKRRHLDFLCLFTLRDIVQY